MTLQRLITFKLNEIVLHALYRRQDGSEADPNTKARRQEENRLAWCDYFGRLAASLRSLAEEEYDHRAQALLENRGEGAS